MARYCPILEERVVYLTCLECEEKKCEQSNKKVIEEENGYGKNLRSKKWKKTRIV